jgi:hypothetical protein
MYETRIRVLRVKKRLELFEDKLLYNWGGGGVKEFI